FLYYFSVFMKSYQRTLLLDSAPGFSPKADAKVRTSGLPAKCFPNFFRGKQKVFTFLDINQAAATPPPDLWKDEG
ncbi:MAG: hypothetical protein J6Y23_04460, partial [Prevotella sp.]|nr:hypothetical protein [Prevotella sp.]